MHRKILLFLLILLPLGAFAQRTNYVISPVNAETVVTEEGLMRGIEFLTSPLCEGRATGTPGSFMAADWVRSSFIAAGLVPFDGSWVHGFPCEGGEAGHNVMGMYRGNGERYIIIMAHFDNLGILNGNLYPGADSNASGVVAMATLAHMLRRMENVGKTYSTNIIFAGIDGKIKNFGGARQLYGQIAGGKLKDPVNGRTISRDRVDLVINLDQLGSTEAPLSKGRPEYLILLGDESYAKRDLLLNVNRTRRLDMDLAFSYYGSKDFTRLFLRQVSDQKVFLDGGIPSVMFTSGITMRNNKTADTADGIDLPVLRKRVILIFHWLARWI